MICVPTIYGPAYIKPEEIVAMDSDENRKNNQTAIYIKHGVTISSYLPASDIVAMIENAATSAQKWKDCADAWDNARCAAQQNLDFEMVRKYRKLHISALECAAYALQDEAIKSTKNDYVWKAKIAPYQND